MLPLPRQPLDPIKLADWLELNALLAPDRNSSSGDLISALITSGLLDGAGRDAVDRKSLDVFNELERRAQAAESAYPFSIDGGLVTFANNWNGHAPYIFCLCLSYFGWEPTQRSRIFPRRLFEFLACDVAKNYVKGSALRFASPRQGIPSGFGNAITRLCLEFIKEGKGFRSQPTLNRQDDAVDIVAWAEFPDCLSGKILMFGNCASGDDWEGKVTDLQPSVFCSQWMIEPPSSEIHRALFIPHRIDKLRWDYYTRRAGVIFDRCRMAYWAGQLPHSNAYDSRSALLWAKTVLRGAAN